ncbi:hypothetical protein SS50377_20102 [Spironucleus salmonicida]|nr:hypothetical protein SS50377_20102 [Spironucleus salmonicida]
MFQQNQITFEKRQYLQMNPANIKSQEKEEEEYSVDVDQESNSESREISLGSSMQNFVVETQESQEINVNIHRQLWNQQQFQDFTQAQKTKIIEDEHQYQSDDITDKEIDNELTLESETESESVNKLDEEEQKIDDITQSLTNQIGRVHPQKFYKDLKLDISEEDLIQYFKKIQRLQKNQNNNFQELLQKYNIQYSFAQPVSITSTLIVFSYSSGIDFSDKNFTDQIIFSAFTGSINQYAQSQTDIQTIQKFETLIQSYILVQQDSKNKTRPFLTYTDYNIIGYRLLSFYQSLQISGLQHIINAHQASFNDPNGKINYLLTKLGISSQQANQPYQSMDKHLKRLIKKNYYFLSKTYKHSFLFYIPNFIYTNRLLATIEISSFDTALLIQHNPIKYAFQDFQDLAFHMQKAAISLDSIQTKSNYYHYLSDIAEIYQYQHMLINQQQYLKQLPSKNGYFIYHLTSETVFNNEQMSKLCQNIKYMRTTFDCLNLQQKAPNKLQNELYTSGVISLVPGFSGLKFVRVKFKPMDLLYQDCIVVLYQANKYFVHYCKSGFLGGVYSQYLMSGSQLLINQQIDIQKEAIQSIVNTWMEK